MRAARSAPRWGHGSARSRSRRRWRCRSPESRRRSAGRPHVSAERRRESRGDAMKILYVAMADDYGDPARGPSFEDTNFRSALEGMGHELVRFDFMAEMKAHGAEEMNRRLLAAAEATSPDLSFFVLFEDEIEPETIRGVSDAGGPTVNWFTDDHWRFDRFTRHFAPAIDWSITTDRDSLPKYEAIGYENVILSQW